MKSKRKKKTAVKTQARRRPTRLDMIAAEAVQNHAHMSTSDITRRRGVLTAEVEAANQELIELMARTADARGRRARASATLAGIMEVLLNRC